MHTRHPDVYEMIRAACQGLDPDCATETIYADRQRHNLTVAGKSYQVTVEAAAESWEPPGEPEMSGEPQMLR